MRKQIDLDEAIILKLQRIADLEGRKLKPLIEYVLKKYANENTIDNQINLLESIKIVKRKKAKK